MKKTVKKLSLNQETIRRLRDQVLAEIQGGATAGPPCPSIVTAACSTCGGQICEFGPV
jgi:hypothetical protein